MPQTLCTIKIQSKKGILTRCSRCHTRGRQPSPIRTAYLQKTEIADMITKDFYRSDFIYSGLLSY